MLYPIARTALFALDPEVADSLIKEAYAARGLTLLYFADGLGVPPLTLATAIVRYAPKRPTRAELERLLSYVVPHLRS